MSTQHEWNEKIKAAWDNITDLWLAVQDKVKPDTNLLLGTFKLSQDPGVDEEEG